MFVRCVREVCLYAKCVYVRCVCEVCLWEGRVCVCVCLQGLPWGAFAQVSSACTRVCLCTRVHVFLGVQHVCVIDMLT